MPPANSDGQSVTLSSLDCEELLKALSYYQLHLFDSISEKKTEPLTQEISNVSALIKRIHKLQEAQTKPPC